MNEFYERLHTLEGEELSAKRKGLKYQGSGAGELSRLRSAAKEMTRLNKLAAGSPEQQKADIRKHQLELARHALGR